MAGILLTRERIRTYLKSLGHEPREEVLEGRTATYRFWMTPWGHRFAVPDQDHKCATWELELIVKAVDATKPVIH